jgi:ankyrin repeat protein
VNAKDDNGRTPLHLAAAECEGEDVGYKEIAELLIAKGADVNAMDVLAGWTPLDYADGEIGNILRKHGGKIGYELKAAGN